MDNPEFSSYEEDSDFDCNHEREGGGISKTGDDSETKKLKCHNSDEERLCLVRKKYQRTAYYILGKLDV